MHNKLDQLIASDTHLQNALSNIRSSAHHTPSNYITAKLVQAFHHYDKAQDRFGLYFLLFLLFGLTASLPISLLIQSTFIIGTYISAFLMIKYSLKATSLKREIELYL